MRFIAIDVETANSNMASICSIGIAAFEGGELVDEWYSLIDPEDYFDPVNISIHGIRDGDVMGAPNFLQARGEINRHIGGQTVVTHTHFDRTAMHRASNRWKTSEPLYVAGYCQSRPSDVGGAIGGKVSATVAGSVCDQRTTTLPTKRVHNPDCSDRAGQLDPTPEN